MIRVMRDDSAIRGQSATQSGKNFRGDLYAVRAGLMFQSSKEPAFLSLMLGDKFAHLVDGVNAAEVAVALRHSPGEEAVAAEQNSIDARIFADGFFDEQGKFEAGALPGLVPSSTTHLDLHKFCYSRCSHSRFGRSFP